MPTRGLGAGDPTQRKVVGFRPAGREDDLCRFGTYQIGDRSPGVIQPGFGGLTYAVNARRISE